MTPMYFFLIISVLCNLYNGVALNEVFGRGKYQSISVDMTSMGKYDSLMNSATYINRDGIDHRYPYIENTTEFIPIFAESLKKKRLLEQLRNDNDSMINKQLVLDEYNKNYTDYEYGYNVVVGGLFMDWEAIIE